MKDIMARVIADYEHFQEMPLELSADIDKFLEERPGHKEAEDAQRFLAERFNVLQDEIERWRDTQSMAECLRRLPGVPVEEKEETDDEK